MGSGLTILNLLLEGDVRTCLSYTSGVTAGAESRTDVVASSLRQDSPGGTVGGELCLHSSCPGTGEEPRLPH